MLRPALLQGGVSGSHLAGWPSSEGQSQGLLGAVVLLNRHRGRYLSSCSRWPHSPSSGSRARRRVMAADLHPVAFVSGLSPCRQRSAGRGRPANN